MRPENIMGFPNYGKLSSLLEGINILPYLQLEGLDILSYL